MFLPFELSSSLGLLNRLELSCAKVISLNEGLFEDLDEEGLGLHGDTVFLTGVCNGFVSGKEFKALLKLQGETVAVLLASTGDVLIFGKGGGGKESTLF